LTSLDPTPKKFSGEVSCVEIDLGDDAENVDHLITPEQRLRLAWDPLRRRPETAN
jgi:hypothetical protein